MNDFCCLQIYLESLRFEPCILVRVGDRLGVYFEEEPTAVAYVFDADLPRALGVIVPEPVAVGNVTEFDSLFFPYDFSLAAYFSNALGQYNLSLVNESQPGSQYAPRLRNTPS